MNGKAGLQIAQRSPGDLFGEISADELPGISVKNCSHAPLAMPYKFGLTFRLAG